MKKLTCLFLFLVFFYSFYISYCSYEDAELAKFTTLEEQIGKTIFIPSRDLRLVDPEKIYAFLCHAAKKANVNIIRAAISYDESDHLIIEKYVYLVKNTHYFQNFRLKSGRFLSPECNEKNVYLATEQQQYGKQIGTISYFGGKQSIVVRPLRTAFWSLPTSGIYYLENATTKQQHIVAADLAKQAKDHFTASAFLPSSHLQQQAERMHGSILRLQFMNLMMSCIAILCFIYYILYRSRQIAILKLHGFTSGRIWRLFIGKPISIIFIMYSFIASIIACFIPGVSAVFYGTMLYNAVLFYGILVAFSLIPFIFILRVSPAIVLKQKEQTRCIFSLNLILKMICTVFCIFFGIQFIQQYQDVSAMQKKVKEWENIKDYGVFYPLRLVPGEEEQVRLGQCSDNDRILHGAFYFFINRKGALLLDTRDYIGEVLQRNAFLHNDQILSLLCNPNALKKFRIFDVAGNRISISENETKRILLVPEQYSTKKKEILKYFLECYQKKKELDHDYFQVKIPKQLEDPIIQIIWIKRGQKIFSFNPDIFPAEQNKIIDPIIQVITEKNSLFSDRETVLGGGATDPLKVKLVQRSAALTYKRLKPDLERLGIQDNLRNLVRIQEPMLQRIVAIEQGIQEILRDMVLLCILMIFLLAQNVTLYWNNKKRIFMVKRLFGLGFWRTYQAYFYLMGMLALIEGGVCLYFRSQAVLSVCIWLFLLFLLECFVSTVTFIYLERNHRTEILKGGA